MRTLILFLLRNDSHPWAWGTCNCSGAKQTKETIILNDGSLFVLSQCIPYSQARRFSTTWWMACCNWKRLFIYGKFANRSLSIIRPLDMTAPLNFSVGKKAIFYPVVAKPCPWFRAYHWQKTKSTSIQPLLQTIYFTQRVTCMLYYKNSG